SGSWVVCIDDTADKIARKQSPAFQRRLGVKRGDGSLQRGESLVIGAKCFRCLLMIHLPKAELSARRQPAKSSEVGANDGCDLRIAASGLAVGQENDRLA